jgi:hypothetical protein
LTRSPIRIEPEITVGQELRRGYASDTRLSATTSRTRAGQNIVGRRIVRTHPTDDLLISADESRYRRYDLDPRSPDRPSAVRQLMRRMEIVQPYPASSVVRKFPDGMTESGSFGCCGTGPRLPAFTGCHKHSCRNSTHDLSAASNTS